MIKLLSLHNVVVAALVTVIVRETLESLALPSNWRSRRDGLASQVFREERTVIKASTSISSSYDKAWISGWGGRNLMQHSAKAHETE